MKALSTAKILTKPLVFKPQCALAVRDMSRPQLQPYVQSAGPTGPIVNGGLIDFQDNMHRGVPDYTISPSMIAAQQQQMQQQQAGGMVPLMPGMAMMPAQMQPGNPSLVPACASASPQWVSGPASYYHVNGVMYAPVGDPVAQAAVLSKIVVKTPEAEHVESADVVHNAIREEDPGKRVNRQVQAYMKKKSKETFCVAAGAGGGSRKQKTMTAEEVAAARVSTLNAAMPKNASRVDASIRGRW